ncbi:hypothetical protein AAVH_29277 [Aphelenchoides avenae]|nr:hypothetical protein AAVH_29277 [Aphelenchus avenae]
MARALHVFVALFAFAVAANEAARPIVVLRPPKESLLNFVPPALAALLPASVKAELALLDKSDLLAVKQIAKKYAIYDDLQQA